MRLAYHPDEATIDTGTVVDERVVNVMDGTWRRAPAVSGTVIHLARAVGLVLALTLPAQVARADHPAAPPDSSSGSAPTDSADVPASEASDGFFPAVPTTQPGTSPTHPNARRPVIRMVRLAHRDHDVVRSGPGDRFAIAGVFPKGKTFEVIARNGDWYGVRLSDSETGWVHASLCKEFDDFSGLEYRPNPRRALATALLIPLAVAPVAAKEHPPVQARAGLDLAGAAALSWAADAFLVYVENDEDVDTAGAAARWGYLYYSPTLDKARGYSVEGGRIRAAENLEMKLEAPPLDAGWIDSGAAIAAADDAVGAAYRKRPRGRLATMLLMRGAFSEGDPDRTTWTLVYHADGQPPLFVVVDAADGKVRRTWRG